MGTRRVIVARVGAAVPLVLGVSLVSFLLVHLAPGSFLDRLRVEPAIPQTLVDSLAERYGLNQPWYRQYVFWLGGAVRGDLGPSIAFQRPVVELLQESVFYSAALLLCAGLAGFLGGVGLAILASTRPGGVLDRVLSALALLLVSVPTLFLAVGALGFAAVSGFLPIGGGSEPALAGGVLGLEALDFARHLVLPAAVLSLAFVPLFFLQARGALVEVLPSEFARAARSRGLSSWEVLIRHCLRTALVPLVTYAGSSAGRLLNGAFVVEAVTGWPGIGRLAWTALVARDSFLLMGVLVLAASLLITGNLAADLLAAALDPRVRVEERWR